MSTSTHWPVTIELPIHWGDMDALGHVNNVMFFRYLESSRVAYIAALGLGSLRDVDGVGFILQHAECRFRRPVVYPDVLRASARLVEMREDRFTLEHEIFSTKQNVVAALGRGTIVTYDYAAGKKVDVPRRVLEGIEELERGAGRTGA
jgi:acyl-CoA thioester hydrolase